MSNNGTRCKQCGKVIVGGGKMGLCDSCFNKDATKTVGIAGGGYVLFRVLKKHGKAILNGLEKILKTFK